MKELCARKMWLLFAVGLLGTLVLVSPGLTQSDRTVSVDFRETPIKAALETLFRGTGYSYTVDPGEARLVTVSLRDVPFLSALSTVVRSAGLAYKVEDGVYAIRPKGTTPAPATTYQPPISQTEVELPPAEVRLEKIPLNYADAFDIADMFGSQVIVSRMSSMMGGGSHGYGFGSQGNSSFAMPGFGNKSYGYGGYGGNSGGLGGGYGNQRSSYGGLGGRY